LKTMSNEQLIAFRQAHPQKHDIEWPPKYVSYRADDQNRLKIYMDRISSVGGTCEFWEYPSCYQLVWYQTHTRNILLFCYHLTIRTQRGMTTKENWFSPWDAKRIFF
jgi:hypothetical protein